MDIENINIKKKLSIVFMGTPIFAVEVLKSLIEKYNVLAVVTQPDKKVGRKAVLTPSPVKKFAEDNLMLVLQPESLRDSWSEVVALHPTMIVTCAYGQIVPRELLVYPEYGCINVHASLLPKLRGGAPIQRAIMEGYKETGITVMYMSPGLDEGDIISKRAVIITDTDTYESLHDKLSIVGSQLLLDTIPSLVDKTASRIKQDNNAYTYASNIKREDEKLDFSLTTREIYNQVRGLYPVPGTFTRLQGKVLKVYKVRVTENNFTGLYDGEITDIYKDGIGVKVSNGEIVITELQLEGKNKTDGTSFVNGKGKNLKGEILG